VGPEKADPSLAPCPRQERGQGQPPLVMTAFWEGGATQAA